MTLPVLAGERVTLRAMTEAEASHLGRWFSDEEFQRYQWGAWHGPMSLEESRAFWTRFQAADAASPDTALFAIEHGDAVVGFANYRRLNARHANVDIGIGIGEKALWGRGLGTDALRLLVTHLLDERGMHRVRLHVAATNDRAIASYRKAGFEIEGIEREGVRGDDGGWADMAVMGLVKGRAGPAFDPAPVTLVGEHVRLEPLRMEHAEALFEAGDEDDIWRWVQPRPAGREGYARYIRRGLDEQVLGSQVPFVVKRPDGEVIGSTRYAHIDRVQRSLEIGYTWYGKGARRTAVNTEAKYLLLSHAFALGAIRVWLQTDIRNERSQGAIARIGAKKEGELRSERLRPDGTHRTSVVFSVVEPEWPETKAHLERLLGR